MIPFTIIYHVNITEITNVTKKLYVGVLDGKLDIRRALGLLGEFVVGKMKRRITTLKSPINAESTKKRKGSANPLIDHSQYRNSITHVEVVF